jgi:hypothetical protein
MTKLIGWVGAGSAWVVAFAGTYGLLALLAR